MAKLLVADYFECDLHFANAAALLETRDDTLHVADYMSLAHELGMGPVIAGVLSTVPANERIFRARLVLFEYLRTHPHYTVGQFLDTLQRINATQAASHIRSFIDLRHNLNIVVLKHGCVRCGLVMHRQLLPVIDQLGFACLPDVPGASEPLLRRHIAACRLILFVTCRPLTDILRRCRPRRNLHYPLLLGNELANSDAQAGAVDWRRLRVVPVRRNRLFCSLFGDCWRGSLDELRLDDGQQVTVPLVEMNTLKDFVLNFMASYL